MTELLVHSAAAPTAANRGRRNRRGIRGRAWWAWLVMAALPLAGPVAADTCADVVHRLNGQLHPKIGEDELVAVLEALNRSGGTRLPSKFVTKRAAERAGWSPGGDLWAYAGLAGKSIGGDVFRNREHRLPDGDRRWREADLDYQGGHRGPKRLVYSDDGLRTVTVDHYRTFVPVPPCR
jgi:ribonuclease T1